jgi:hypothetical protein
MRRKPKSLSTRIPARKSALSASAASRRAFPAWIDAESAAVSFPAVVTPRVRDGLVLRTVVKRKPAAGKNSDAHGAR